MNGPRRFICYSKGCFSDLLPVAQLTIVQDIGRFDASRKKEISPPSRVLVYTTQPLINYISIVR